MEIFLFRVCERADGSLFLERKPHATTADDYIAISHVWGSPDTIARHTIDGAPGPVWLGPGKKDILSILSREDVCGKEWFWMDLFSMDQTETAAISISDQLQSIPHVYKSSRRVKVLFEHSLCQSWQAKAMSVLHQYGAEVHIDGFQEQELLHGQRCRSMPFFDPWFERLWTRQEGLYGQILDAVFLNVVPCERSTDATSHSNVMDSWMNEGLALSRRTAAEFFVADKIAYHGLDNTSSDLETLEFQLYTDLIYRHRLDVSRYQAIPGPASTYSPLLKAWRSNRLTTKERDYVLAVFPDIAGYAVPPGARKMTFTDLLSNALSQRPLTTRFGIACKVPRGLMENSPSPMASLSPWIFPHPANAGDAYDSLTLFSCDSSSSTSKLFLVTRQASALLKDVPSNNADLAGIVELCSRTMDGPKQMALTSPTGPCTGVDRADAGTQTGLVHQYLIHQFAPYIVSQHLPIGDLVRSSMEFKSTGAISFDTVNDVPQGIFSSVLQQYLVCMVCGTSRLTADLILQEAMPGVVTTPFGKLLAVLHKQVYLQSDVHDGSTAELQVICPPLWYAQGFLVARLREDGSPVIVGRTVVPSSAVWDAITAGLQG